MGRRVLGLVLRHLYLYRRSVARAGEVVFWPVMDLFVWGFVTHWLETVTVPGVLLFLLGAQILWDVHYRAQQAISLAITEEIWTRNILNIFTAPVSTFELLLSTCLLGVIKAVITCVVLGALAAGLYAFNLFSAGPALLPYVVALVMYGWAVGMTTSALILRYGQAAEALVWGVPFLIQPVSAVFYPIETLPPILRSVAVCLPTTHVFQGMREAFATGTAPLRPLVAAFALNILYIVLGAAFFGFMLRRVRDRGLLARLGLQ